MEVADEVIVLSESYYPRCFLDRDEFMVNNSSLLIGYASSSSCLVHGGKVIAGMTLDETGSSLAKSHTTLLRCRQATRTVAVRG